MRFVLSRQGQADVTRLGSYLPLTAAFARQQLKKLDQVIGRMPRLQSCAQLARLNFPSASH